jgi:competence protein ComFC
MLIKVIDYFLDILFPPSETEIILKRITTETIYKKCQKNNESGQDNMFSIFKYKDLFIKDCIYELKNNKNKHAIRIFSEILKEEIIYYLEENLIDVDNLITVTWVPQHKSTYLDKGYNQAEELVKAICSSSPQIFQKVKLLIKTKKTKPQHEIKNKKERLKNLNGVFEISNPNLQISNALIILIDDVYTTGATLKESRRVLLQNGASKVVCFTIAH